MTIGQRLRAAREANEMTIGDIARRTYIQPKFIQAIDEDNFAMIPDSHRRLFVREYAKLVGLNPEELMTLLPEYEPPPPSMMQEPVESTSRGWRRSKDETGTTSSAPPVPSLPESERKAYSEVLRRLSSGGGVKLGSSNTTMWLIGGAVGLLIIAIVYYVFFSGSVVEQSAGDGTVADTAAGSPTEIITRNGGDTATTAQPGTPVSDDSLTLEGKATAKVWFAIVMDGKKSETGTLDSGGTKVWRAAETFKLSLGNAGGLMLSLNERPLGTLGPPRTSIRNQIIDVNGVKKTGPTRRASTSSARRTQRQTSPTRVITPTELRRSEPSR